jgi:site-specific recombinase XerD
MLKDMRPVAQTTTLQSVANEYTKQLREEKRTTYAKLIEYHVKKFLKYTRGDIALQNITTITIDGYAHLLRSGGASPAYESICLMNIRTLVNRAIKMRLVSYDIHPFSYWRQQNGEPKELDISVENLRLLINSQFKPKKTRRAVDFFLLSYYLGGMNMADLLYYDFRGYKDNPILHYQRRKTANKKRGNKTIEFTIQPEAFPIIDKYMNPKTGHIAEVKESKYNTFLGLTNRALKRAAEKLGINQRISFYSARKSFVQHGFELGIPLETLEYCIGQSMKANRPIFNYVKIMRAHADLAIRQILDYIKEE